MIIPGIALAIIRSFFFLQVPLGPTASVYVLLVAPLVLEFVPEFRGCFHWIWSILVITQIIKVALFPTMFASVVSAPDAFSAEI